MPHCHGDQQESQQCGVGLGHIVSAGSTGIVCCVIAYAFFYSQECMECQERLGETAAQRKANVQTNPKREGNF